MKTSSRRRESYSLECYKLTAKEKGYSYIKSTGVVLLFSYFFYRSIWAALLLSPLIIFLLKKEKKHLLKKKKEELKQQFKEAILIIASNLKAGYSIENAFLETGAVMEQLFGSTSIIVRIMQFIKSGLKNNIPLEKQLRIIGDKSGIEEIKEFAEVFEIVKLQGGNMVQIMEQTSILISQRLETDKEIEVMLSAKKFEQKIMNGIPFFFLAYLEVTSPGFFAVLYHNITGVIFMSICLLLYLSAYEMSERLIDITV